jgi:potassium-transporting ATPase KdpC subunit
LKAQVRPAILSFLALTVLTGLAYPILLTGLARMVFPGQAGGSLVRRNGRVVGSLSIGQAFTEPGDFWGRPSATAGPDAKPLPYNGAGSGGSNLSPGNPEWRKTVAARAAALQAADPEQRGPIPIDLVTASGSGLDPDISPEAAGYQAHRVAKARGLGLTQVQALVPSCTERPQLAFLGEARVNVLKLNLALDAMQGK